MRRGPPTFQLTGRWAPATAVQGSIVSNSPVIYVDIDDTLVRTFGAKQIPMTPTVHGVRRLAAQGATLVAWSAGGADYARSTVEKLGLTDCFTAYLPKPTVMIDDQAPADWRQTVLVRPSEAAEANLAELCARVHLPRLPPAASPDAGLWRWTQDDFSRMNWHDCTVHARYGGDERGEIRFDLDYLVEWIAPQSGETHFRFRIAPATLAFHQASDLRRRHEPPDDGVFVIQNVEQRPTPHAGVWEYVFETLGGRVSLLARGYTQELRAPPVHWDRMSMSLSERGGIAFDLTTD